jgi:cytidylate kinase
VAIITISRGSLSGGRAVAECLVRQLGCRSLAREILRRAAGKLGASEEIVQAKFETTPGLWARMSRERERYVLAVQTALAEACVEGSLVYHGLAGQFLLRGLPGVVRVRLISPLEKRVRTLMDSQHRMTAKAAEEFIRNVDQDRRRWVKLTYGADVEDPSLYDVTVNLRSLSVESACVAIVEAAAQPEYAFTEAVRRSFTEFAAECHRRLDAVVPEA